MTDLRSNVIPPVTNVDHVRHMAVGKGETLIAYADFECPYCAVLQARVAPAFTDAAPSRWVVRHFPSRSAYPRSWPAACAAEAAGLQGRFWEMHDLLFADQGRLEDPHLWARAEKLGLDVERFDNDRRSEAVRVRVQSDFDAAVRAGVVRSPTVICDGVLYAGDGAEHLLDELGGSAGDQEPTG